MTAQGTDVESAPLLVDADSTANPPGGTRPLKATTPLPKRQLFVLCWMRFSEPVSFNLIFPFINEMLVFVGIANPGYSSGFVEGVFAFAQLCTVFYWGSLSDRIGRRPVLLMGLAGTALFTCLFGFSGTFLMILVSRMLIGGFNGNVAVLKSSIAELTDETNQGRAFSFLPLSWSMGSVIAPLIGGFLARPAERFPSLFGSSKLFIEFPYLLACLAGAAVTVLGWIVGFFFLEESLGREPPKVRARAQTPRTIPLTSTLPPNYGATSGGDAPTPVSPIPASPGEVIKETAPRRMTASEILRDVHVQRILACYIFLALVTVSIDAVMVLWLFTPVNEGGLGFTTAQIGVVLSSIGISATFINLVVFPPLQLKVGTVAIYRACFMIQAIIIMLFPIIRCIASGEYEAQMTHSLDTVWNPGPWTRIGVGVLVVFKCIGGMVFACNMILVSAAAPSRNSLGAVNGLAQMVASAMRAFGPTLATIFFALSNDPKYHLLGGNFAWVYLFVLAMGGIVASSRIQEGRADRQ